MKAGQRGSKSCATNQIQGEQAMKTTVNDSENQGFCELTSDQMRGVRAGATMVEYALLIGGIALIAAVLK
jgi:hypothetical protein